MVHLKEKTSGIDCEIQEMQQDFYDALTKQFHFSKVEAYGRLYRNEKAEGVYPEWWDKNKQDYEPVYLDDTKNVRISFIDGQSHSTEDGIFYQAPVKIVFWFNLNAIDQGAYPDAEAQRIVSFILNKKIKTDFEYDRLQKGLRGVYSGFNVNGIKFDDREPFHVFSLNINLTYQLTKNCT